MAEDKTTTEQKAGKGDLAEGQDENGGRSESPQKTLGRRASRSLRRARQAYQNNDWQDSGEAAFLLREANVLALLDVAEAIRETQRSGEGT